MDGIEQKRIIEANYLPNEILKEFREKYSELFIKYAELYEKANQKDPIDVFTVIMHLALEWYPKLIPLKEDFFAHKSERFGNFFLCMYEWEKSLKTAYSYSTEVLKKIGNIDSMVFEAKYFIEIPFHTFYLEGNKEWDIHGIAVNIREIPILDTNNRKFEVNAIVFNNGDSLKSIKLEEADISFCISEGDTYGSINPYSDKEYEAIDYYECRNLELRLFVLEMCYLLYVNSHEKENLLRMAKKSQKQSKSDEKVEQWETEHRIIYDDVKPKNTTSNNSEEKTEKPNESVKKEEKKKRKSPRPHPRSGSYRNVVCGSGENKHLEKRWVRECFVNKDKIESAMPVVERRKNNPE